MIPSPSGPDESFAERVRLWRISQNFTQAEAADKLDIERSYLSQIERGREPGKVLRTRFLLIERNSSVKFCGTVGASYSLRKLPVLSWAQAGQTIDPAEIPSNWDDVVPSDVFDERAFGVRLHGDSMEPKLSGGDVAIVLPGTIPTNGDIVVANLKNQGVLCKIMHAQLDKTLVQLSGYNPAYPPTEYLRDEFHWIFPVTTIVKQLRRR